MGAHALAAEPRSAMSLNIPPEFERAILDRVASGAYETPEEVLKACLEALDRYEDDLSVDHEWLKRAIQEGIESAENEPLIPSEVAIERMRARTRGVHL